MSKINNQVTFFYIGIVYVKENISSTEEISYSLLKEGATFDSDSGFPQVIHPAGLSAQRQWYLYQKIREYCPESDRNLTCLLPNVAKTQCCPTSPSSPPTSPLLSTIIPLPLSTNIPSALPTTETPRKCEQCQQSGHYSRTCPNGSRV